MVSIQSGWPVSSVVGLNPDWLIALQFLEAIDVPIFKMLEWGVLEPVALKEPSDFKEALPLVGVWRSAATMLGAQYVMMDGTLLMLK